MTQANDSGSATAEPPDSQGVLFKGATGVQSRMISAVTLVPVRFIRRFPLIVGALLLVAINTMAVAADTIPTFRSTEALGGGDYVEVLIIEDAPSFSGEQYYVKGAPPFFELSQLTENILADRSSNDLVTVAWSPLTIDGASGHGVKTYVVEGGDVLGSIAESFGVSMFALAYSNNIVDPDSIQPGDKLRVPPVEGVLHVVKKGESLNGIAKKYSADTAEILTYNGLPADGSVLNIGDELVIPNGEPPAPPKPKYVSTYSGPAYTTNRIVLGYFIAPTTGHNYGRRHSNNGVDISNSCGTPIYAAAAGYVNRSDAIGWNGGYGKVIRITHGNGTETLYAHNSRNLVAPGETVGQGQLIALMGSTGRSTGCHLHFEVHGAGNPLVR